MTCAGWPRALSTMSKTLNIILFPRQYSSTSGMKELWRSLQNWLSCSKPWDLLGNKLKGCLWLSLVTRILWMINMIHIMKQTQRGSCTLKLKHDMVVTWDIFLDYLVAKVLAYLRSFESWYCRLVFGNVGSTIIYFRNNPISFMLQFWYAVLTPSLVIFL